MTAPMSSPLVSTATALGTSVDFRRPLSCTVSKYDGESRVVAGIPAR